jgi:hypothetical protein
MYPYDHLIQIFPDPAMRRLRILPHNMPPPRAAPATVLYSQIFPPPGNWLGVGARKNNGEWKQNRDKVPHEEVYLAATMAKEW